MKKNYLMFRTTAVAFLLTAFLSTLTVKATDYHVTDVASFNTAFTAAVSGSDVIYLASGTYNFGSTTKTLTQSLTVKAEPSALTQPVLVQITFAMGGNVSFTLDGVEAYYDLEGAVTPTSAYFITAVAGTYSIPSITIRNSKIHGYGRNVIRADNTSNIATIGSIVIDNCIMYDIGRAVVTYPFLGLKSAKVSNITITNSTFYNSPNNLWTTQNNTVYTTFLMQNCSVYKVTSSGSDPLVNCNTNAAGGSYTISNCIFSDSYDATTVKMVIKFNSNGTTTTAAINNTILNNFATPKVTGTYTDGTLAVSALSYDYPTLMETTTPNTITDIGDPRWSLNPDFFFTDGNWSNAGNWSDGVPAITRDAIIAANCAVDGNATVKNISVTSGISLTVNGGNSLTINGSTNNASLIQLNNSAGNQATIITNGSLSGAGIYYVQQYLTGAGGSTPNDRFWYISSPVTAATSNVFTPSASAELWSWSEAGQAYTPIIDNVTFLSPMNGYVVKLGANATYAYSGGTLNSGYKSLSITNSGAGTYPGYVLAGNPYPSYLDWELAQAASTNLDPSMWYRTFNSGSSLMVFDTYNAAGHIGTNNGSSIVTKYIPPMQGFWVLANAGGGTLNTNNSMLSHQPGAVLKSAKVDNNSVLRLVVANGNKTDQAVIYFNQNATSDKFSSPKMFANIASLPEIYTVAKDKQLVLKGLKDISANPSVALGLKTSVAGTFTITASQISGFEASQPIYLKDNLLNVIQDLRAKPVYTFNSEAANTTDRFTVLFQAASPTEISKLPNDQNTLVYASKGLVTVVLNGNTTPAGEITVYNLLGQEVGRQKITDLTTNLNTNLASGTYLVKVKTAEQSVTKKVIIKN